MAMKNRRAIIVIFMLCACLLVGVGYAALTDVLDITGSGVVTRTNALNAFMEDVYFSEVSTSADNGYTASINADNNNKASFTVNTLAGQNDSETISFTIVNENDLDAKVTIRSSSNTNSTYFGVAYSIGGVALSETDGIDLPDGGEVVVDVTVTLLETPNLNEGEVESFSSVIEINVTSVDSE